MCGRFQLTQDSALVASYFKAQATFEFGPRYNIAPRQDVPVIHSCDDGREIVPMNWGFVPSWTKDFGRAVRPINAKAETVATSGLFRNAFTKRRCIIPATGFYEWSVVTPKQKQPYSITVTDRELFGMAGVYESYCGEDQIWHQTFTIITTEPNDLVSNVHDRMPVILAHENESLWLNPSTPVGDLLGLLSAYPETKMFATPISPRVNKVANDDSEVLSPYNS